MTPAEKREALERIYYEGDYDGVECVANELESEGLIYVAEHDASECWQLTEAGLLMIC